MKIYKPRGALAVIVAIIIALFPCLITGCEKGAPAKAAPFPDAKFAVISDAHYYDPALGTSGGAFKNSVATERKLIAESAEIVNFAIDEIAASGVKFVLVTGDMTKDGELVNHRRMAQRLSKLTEKGIKVYVIPGNHDINNPRSCGYSGGKAVRAANVTAEQFSKIYSDFGYGGAVMRDPSSLSYVAEPLEGLWVVALDSCRYNENKNSAPESSGGLTDKEISWLKDVLLKANARNKAVIVMMHHGVVEHWAGQGRFNPAYLIDNYQKVGKLLASYGVRVVFTGHYHTQDIAKADFGRYGQLYDIETGSLITPPCAVRYCAISGNTLTVRSDGLLKKIRPGTDFEQKSIKRVRAVIYNAYASKVKKYGAPESDARYIAGAMADAAMANFYGDEDPSWRPAFDERKLSKKGRKAYSKIKYVIDGLWNDLEPRDNNCTIVFKN